MKFSQAVIGMAIAAAIGFLAGFAVNARAGAPQESSPSGPKAPKPPPAPRVPPPLVDIPLPPEPSPMDVQADQKSVPVDLSMHFNAELTGDWHDRGSTLANDLSELPPGPLPLGGTTFNIQGVIQLGGRTSKSWGARYPATVADIKVGLGCRRLQFLIGTGLADQEAAPIAKVVVRHADGKVSEMPILYGKHVRDWWFDPRQPRAKGGVIAWSGRNPASRGRGAALQLYKVVWVNPRPESAVESIDLVSLMTKSAPFVVAITADVPLD